MDVRVIDNSEQDIRVNARNWRWLFVTVVAITLCLFPLSKCSTSSSLTEIGTQDLPKQTKEQNGTGRALSLRVLEERVKATLKSSEELDKQITKLGGLKKIYGFVLDRQNRDLILIGKTDNRAPDIYLDELVVAMRNTWSEITPPSCSIDPRAENLAQLQRIASELMAIRDPDKLKEKLPLWRKAGGIQNVRVLGVSRNTQFAKTMVDADYLLKKIVDGSYPLEVKGFKSFIDLMVDDIKQRIARGERSLPPMQIAIRFWFYPSKNSFLEDKDILFIKQSKVTLLTEEEFLTSTGEMIGAGRPHPVAKVFVDSFTELYEEIAKVEPLYGNLESLYRLVALTRLFKYRDISRAAGLNFNYWLRRYPVKEISVPSTLPAISNIKEVNFQIPTSGGILIGYLWIPTSGGVSIDIHISSKQIEKDKTGILMRLKNSVLDTRPSLKSLTWDFPMGEEVLRRLKFQSRRLILSNLVQQRVPPSRANGIRSELCFDYDWKEGIAQHITQGSVERLSLSKTRD